VASAFAFDQLHPLLVYWRYLQFFDDEKLFSSTFNDKPKHPKQVVTNVILFIDSCHTCDQAAD